MHHNVRQRLEGIKMLGEDSGSEDNEFLSHVVLRFMVRKTLPNDIGE